MNLFLVDLASETNGESSALGLLEDLNDLGKGEFLLFGEYRSVMHFLFEDVLRYYDLFLVANRLDLISHDLLDLEVACVREPVSDCEILFVPKSLVTTLFLFFLGLFLSTLFKNVFHILEDDVLNGPVVDLSELVIGLGGQVDHGGFLKKILAIIIRLFSVHTTAYRSIRIPASFLTTLPYGISPEDR